MQAMYYAIKTLCAIEQGKIHPRNKGYQEYGAQKRVSGKQKTCIRFPHERPKAMPEGRTKLSGTNFE